MNIDEWIIEEPRSSESRSVGLGIIKTDDGKYEVFLFNGDFGGSDPILGTMESLDDARRFANAFMSDISTWDKLKAYFVTHTYTDLWESLYR